MGFKVVIPARYNSTRLPGKPLRDIAGKPLVRHVYERARESQAEEIVIATDDGRVAETCIAFGADVQLTAKAHASGSDRVAEVAKVRDWSAETAIVNLQGDEPCTPANLIDQVAADLAMHRDVEMTTLACPIDEPQAPFDPHIVKVVTNAQGMALYFSRAPIPYHRDAFARDTETLPDGAGFLRHIGLYAYRAGFVRRYVSWPPTPLEQAESLEQLRALWHGEKIYVATTTEVPGPGVDTPADLARAGAWLAARAEQKSPRRRAGAKHH